MVQRDGGAIVHSDGYQTMIRFRARSEPKAGALAVRFESCEPDNQFECQYKGGEPLLTLVRKPDGSTVLRYGGLTSNLNTKELAQERQ